MTEESLLEILNKHISYSANSDVHQELPSILSAMKEAMRIESIGFAEWINKNCAGNNSSDRLWDYYSGNSKAACLSSEELYAEYIKSIK